MKTIQKITIAIFLSLGIISSFGYGNVPTESKGSSGVLLVTATSSAILSASAVTLATASGDIQIDSIVEATDATGVAGCTNVNILNNNTVGKTGVIAAAAAATLGANTSLNVTAFGVTPLASTPWILKDTKIIQHQATVAPCTGAGTITYVIKYTRLADGAALN